jgi:nucleoside-diphosphate kinase
MLNDSKFAWLLFLRCNRQSFAAGVVAAAPAASKLQGFALLAASSAVVAYQYARKPTHVHCSALPVQGVPGTNLERTFLAVKPDGVQRGLIGDIIARFEKRGYKVRLETL